MDFFKNVGSIKGVKELHSILGMINYYRSFIPGYTEKTKTLYSMVNKKTSFDEEMVEKQIKKLTEFLTGKIWLDMPRFDLQFILEVDVSNIGVGGILKQLVDDKELTVRYASRSLKPAERNYSTIERELLAIVYSIKEFRHYLGNKFILRTDHKPLVYLRQIKDSRGRVARWLLFLEQFNFEVVHLKGDKNVIADHLSRAVELGFISKESDVEKIKEAHQLCGHGCANVTFIFMQKHYKEVPTLRAIREFVNRCSECMKFKRRSPIKMHPVLRDKPFDMIGIDTIGPFPKTSSGNRYIILATDYATNWSEGIACRRKSSETVVKFLLEIFHRHGAPKEIRCDMGGEFLNKVVKGVADKWGAKM